MTFIVFIIVVVLVFILIAVIGKTPEIIRSHWEHYFSEYQFSGQEFYDQVKDSLEKMELPGVTIDREAFRQSHLLSARREYLRISRNEYCFYIAGVHFGTGSYVSWWMTETVEQPINKIPIISKWLGKDRKNKTFYQMDTEEMYKAAVHSSVTEVLESMTKYQNMRPFSAHEQRFINIA